MNDQGRGVQWVCVALVAAGFVSIALGWRGAARTLEVPFQMPFLVSGGLGGLALIVVGAGLFVVQLGRRLAASERNAVDRLLLEVEELATRDRRTAPTRRGRR